MISHLPGIITGRYQNVIVPLQSNNISQSLKEIRIHCTTIYSSLANLNLSFKYHSTTTHVLYPEVSFSNSHVFSPFASSSVFLPHSSSLPIPLLHHQCLWARWELWNRVNNQMRTSNSHVKIHSIYETDKPP